MTDRAIAVGQNRQRAVIAHRADGFLAVLGHGREDDLDLLHGHAGGGLTPGALVIAEQERLGTGAHFALDLAHILQPGFVRVLGCELIKDFAFAQEAALGEIHRNHPPRRHRAALDDAFGFKLGHAGFRAHGQKPVFGQRPAQRTQAIAIKARNRPTAIARNHGGGPVPGLHHRVAILIKPPPGAGHDLAAFGPGFWD